MKIIRLLLAGLFAVASVNAPAAGAESPVEADVVVYGGTPGGIMAAIAAAKAGQSVALIDLNNRVGGVVSGGLTASDMGDRAAVGGLSLEFFNRVAKYYRDKYGADSEQVKRSRNGTNFEPSVAEAIFEQMLKEQPKIRLWRKNRFKSATVENGRITSLITEDTGTGGTREFRGRMFIDASYEGDLMAASGAPSTYGREGRDQYNEYLAGISEGPDKGKADDRVMTYNYRVSITPEVSNRVLWPKPENYDPEPWRNMGRRVIRENLKDFGDILLNAKGRMGPNRKLDLNWADLAEANVGYVEGDWATREKVAQRYRDHFLSVLWYLQNDPELPEEFRQNARNWGFPKDEFTDTGNFPFQLYVREARRMIGAYVLTEKDVSQDRYKADAIAAGSYGIDCHAVRFITIGKRKVVDSTPHNLVSSYDIPYRSIIPATTPENLLVPVCLSASHVAYCSVRMEPVFMMLGQAAGTAAALAIEGNTSVQKVNVEKLRADLRAQGAVLDFHFEPQVEISWSPKNPQPGQPVTFSLVEKDVRAPLTDYWWDFVGDGAVASTAANPTHTFQTEKLHHVSVIVKDAEGRRNLVSAEVPVGSGTAADVTVDDRDAEVFGAWEGTYPMIDRKTRAPDFFYGLGDRELESYPKENEPLVAKFAPAVKVAGKYRVCLGFRPDKKQAQDLPVVIRHAGGETTVTVDQRETDSPFYWFPLGDFRFEPGQPAAIEIPNRETKGKTVIDGVRLVFLGD